MCPHPQKGGNANSAQVPCSEFVAVSDIPDCNTRLAEEGWAWPSGCLYPSDGVHSESTTTHVTRVVWSSNKGAGASDEAPTLVSEAPKLIS